MTPARSTIVVQPAPAPRIAERLTEMCEHKGVGHPGTITDASCEAVALALASVYRQMMIGQPLAQPRLAVVEVAVRDRLTLEVKDRVAAIAREQLEAVEELVERLVQGELSVY